MRHFDDLPFYTGGTKTYAGIGHRDLEGCIEPVSGLPVAGMMTWISSELEKLGYTLNSGGAKGADLAFETGVKDSKHKQVFLASCATDETRGIAKELHPAPSRLAGYALDLMARNTFQVFGQNLDTPVDFVLCFTKDGCESYRTRTRDSGGTGQAIEMASRKGIPVFNMKNPNWIERLSKYIGLNIVPPIFRRNMPW